MFVLLLIKKLILVFFFFELKKSLKKNAHLFLQLDLGSFFSFLSTLLVRRADPSPSQTVTVVSNRNEKDQLPLLNHTSSMNLETEIPLFCNALCSLPQLPHAGGITLLSDV